MAQFSFDWWCLVRNIDSFCKKTNMILRQKLFRMNSLHKNSKWQFCAYIRLSVSHLILESGYRVIFIISSIISVNVHVILQMMIRVIQMFLIIINILWAICIQKIYGSYKLHTSIYNKCDLLLFRFHFQLLLTLLLYISGNYTLISLNFSIITRLYGNVTHLQ